MELRNRLTRWALRRPHVLLVAAPRSPTLRWDVEASLHRRGWAHAASPADTDLVLTAGDLGPELGAAADLLWSQVPRPRHRATVLRGAVEEGLDDAADALVADALLGAAEETEGRPVSRHELPTHGEHADGGHEGHDMGGHDMGGDVAGLPMAGGGPDRDGLELDALTVSLGPVLPGWPTGLVVTATLQGDVLADVRTAVTRSPVTGSSATGGPVSSPPDDDIHPTMHALDALVRLLVVAGWTTAARDAARLRSELWDAGSATPDLARRGRQLTGRVRRSRALAWALRDLRGVKDRVHGWCDAVETGLDGSTRTGTVHAVPLGDLVQLLDGLDVGSARLVVASLPLDLLAASTAVGSP